MTIATLKNVVTSKVGRQVLITQKNSPVILFGAGVIGMVAFAVLSTRATLKLDEVLKESEETSKKIAQAEENASEEVYSEADAKKDKLLNKVQTAGKVAKLYAPAFVVGVATLSALTGSHVIMSRRNVALSAAYATVDKAYKEYRERVAAEFGADKEIELRHGLVDREIAVETDEGPVVKTVKTPGPDGLSMYARCFDETNRNWKRGGFHNQTFISVQQQFANDRLNADGHLFLNDVYKALGLPITSEGQAVGWVRGNGDDHVDFGVFAGDSYMGEMFANGKESSIWLDFNVDGVVWDLI